MESQDKTKSYEEIVLMLTTTKIKEYNLKELGRHNKEKDHWVALHGYIYNVTEFKQKHPGGELVLTAGKDITEVFDNQDHNGIQILSL